jgi:glutathione S-transferase
MTVPSLLLWYARYTRASRPRWALEELGLPYTLERLDLREGEHRQARYLEVNPFGTVPTLVIDGVPMLESSAQVQWIAELAPGLAPNAGDPERPAYLSWFAWSLATLEAPIHTYALHTRFWPEERRSSSVAEDAQGKVRNALAFLDKALDGRDSLLASGFSAADIVVASNVLWARSMGLLDAFPALVAWGNKMQQRPAWKRANAD